ncbi:DedA family protein [Nioella sp. MMSF_3534]|uniref:DedA family protein n=1 Tax=Nioella sp. MMSF_3534 TaxID=3046720 RepID=UPI00273D5F99|nr:DedA family protein [Nioella sp. MMSF_3534]
MTDTIFALVTTWGALVIFASSFLSCLALPIPTSLMMLSGGAFVAAGDLALWQVIAGAWGGAVLGDQTGYLIGRHGGAPLVERIARTPARSAVLNRARGLVDKRGGLGVFFSTWLFAPLGPWVNVIAGTTGLGWLRFTLWDVLGETIWVTIYVGLGYGFASQIEAVSDILGNAVGLLAALAVVGAMVIWIRGALKAQKARRAVEP